jgi:hypothetical protein
METEGGEGAAMEQRIGRMRFGDFRKHPMFNEGIVAIVKGAIFNSKKKKEQNMLSNALKLHSKSLKQYLM